MDKKEETSCRRSAVSRLLDFAGPRKALTYLGCTLSAISMVVGFGPYVCIWLVARDLIAVGSQLERSYEYRDVWLVGGVDVRSMEPRRLMEHVAFVFQTNRLFKQSVLENVRAARPDATREEVVRALSAAQCDDIIEKLPDGVDTVYGAAGAHFTGGERKRISIARALLKGAPIVLLDEATASLDVENETEVQQALSRLLAGKTVIVIAHRMRTVTNADKVVVLDSGRVVERGTPTGLMERDGLFARMVRLQQESAQWAL